MQPGSVSTFDSFVPTAASLEAVTVAIAFGAAEPRAPRLLLMLGPPGIGKSHLLEAIVARARERHATEAILPTNGKDLVRGRLCSLESLHAGRCGSSLAARPGHRDRTTTA